MSDYFLPGLYGFGSVGFDSDEPGHHAMAKHVVEMYENGHTIDWNDPQNAETGRALIRFYGTRNPDELKYKI